MNIKELLEDWLDNNIGFLTLLTIFISLGLFVYFMIATTPRCPKCKEYIYSSDNYCKECGFKLRTIEKVDECHKQWKDEKMEEFRKDMEKEVM